MSQPEFFSAHQTCQAIWQSGPCRNAGSVWCDSRDHFARFLECFWFCQECADGAVADGIFARRER